MIGPDEADWASAAGLVVANAGPLVGVVALGWRVETLLLWYWLDAGVAGAVTVPKIRRAEGEDDPDELPTSVKLSNQPVDSLVGRDRGWLASAFVRDYALFWGIAGLFVFPVVAARFRTALLWDTVVVAVSTIAIHVVAYRVNYLGKRVYETIGPVTQAVKPIRRLLIIYLTVVLGLNVAVAVGNGLAIVVVLVLAKTGFDLRGHWRRY